MILVNLSFFRQCRISKMWDQLTVRRCPSLCGVKNKVWGFSSCVCQTLQRLLHILHECASLHKQWNWKKQKQKKKKKSLRFRCVFAFSSSYRLEYNRPSLHFQVFLVHCQAVQCCAALVARRHLSNQLQGSGYRSEPGSLSRHPHVWEYSCGHNWTQRP